MAEVPSSTPDDSSINVSSSSAPSTSISAPPTQPSVNRSLLSIAQKLHARYFKRAERPACTVLKDLQEIRLGQYAIALKDARLLQVACERGWLTAAQEQRDNLRYSLRHLIAVLEPLRPPENHALPTVPSLRDLSLELLAVQEEFGAIELEDDSDGDGPRLSVTLEERIVLEGRNLGRFRIDIHLNDFRESSPLEWFRIEALEPNAAANDDDVTHPHVSQQRLCTGDAQHPITQALQDGRLSDFFVLVRSVLQTYNAGSAYIELADWDGRRCEDCGTGCSSDQVCWCESCDQDFCEECIRCCTECHCSGCRECLKQSQLSRGWVCKGCVTSCDECGRLGAASDLEDGLCSDCTEAAEDQDENPADEPEALEPAVTADSGAHDDVDHDGSNRDDPFDLEPLLAHVQGADAAGAASDAPDAPK